MTGEFVGWSRDKALRMTAVASAGSDTAYATPGGGRILTVELPPDVVPEGKHQVGVWKKAGRTRQFLAAAGTTQPEQLVSASCRFTPRSTRAPPLLPPAGQVLCGGPWVDGLLAAAGGAGLLGQW
jgi:hypothetical protein